MSRPIALTDEMLNCLDSRDQQLVLRYFELHANLGALTRDTHWIYAEALHWAARGDIQMCINIPPDGLKLDASMPLASMPTPTSTHVQATVAQAQAQRRASTPQRLTSHMYVTSRSGLSHISRTLRASLAAMSLVSCAPAGAQDIERDDDALGSYYELPAMHPREVPIFADIRGQLPIVVFDDRPEFVALYWKAWELAFSNIEKPIGVPPLRGGSDAVASSPAVAHTFALPRTYIDAAFSDNIFQWDTCYILDFAKYGHNAFAFIESLDNFYEQQRKDGFICREFRKSDAAPIMFPTERDSVNPPLFAWAEVQYAKLSGDTSRLFHVLPPLDRYARWIEDNRSIEIGDGDDATKLWNTPFGSGMDNTPEHGDAWVSMSSQVAQMYESLAWIAEHAGRIDRATEYRAKRTKIAEAINRVLWDDSKGVYFNVAVEDSRGDQSAPITFVSERTIGCFWPLWAGIVPNDRVVRVCDVLLSEAEFATQVPFATLSRKHEKFDEWGGYWLGSSWAPTTSMALDGLSRNDRGLDAYVQAYRYLDAMAQVHEATGTIWENYAPMYLSFGGNVPSPQPGQPSKRDFVGWSGLGPIAILIEKVIGIEADAIAKQITWNLWRTDRIGVQGLQVGTTRLSLLARPRELLSDELVIDFESDGKMRIRVIAEDREAVFEITPGRGELRVP